MTNLRRRQQRNLLKLDLHVLGPSFKQIYIFSTDFHESS